MKDMFILVQPMYSKSELNADSNYVVYSQLIREMLSVRPFWNWIVIFPDKESNFKYEDDGFFKLPNVTKVPQRISTRKQSNAISFDGVWYDRLARSIAIDTIWCNLVEIAAYLSSIGDGSFEPKARPVIVAAHNYVIHPSLPYTFEAQQHVSFAQLSGALFADYNVFNSQHCARMLLDNAERWLNPETVEMIKKKSGYINYGTLESGLEYLETGNEVPIIAYNHRLQQYKNYKTTFEILNELYMEGVKFKVYYMNNTRENTATIVKYPFVEIKMCNNRENYIRTLRKCDLNVINSQHETFCISAIESMALGQPLVAPNGITFPEITGLNKTKYPYLFSSIKEQKVILKKLLLDPEERKKWGKVLSQYVIEQFNTKLWAERYAELFERLNDFKLGVAEDTSQFCLDKLKEYSGSEFNEYFRKIINKEINGRKPIGSQSFPRSKVLRVIRMLGGSVKMKEGKQYVYAP